MSGTLTQAPNRSTSHRAAANGINSSDHLTYVPHAPRRTTPNILRTAAAVLGMVAVVAAVVLTTSASGARSKISSVGGTDAPSVQATNDFLFKLQDMDAQLVNALLVNGDTSVHVPRDKSEALYEQDRQDANADLESATVALAGNPSAFNQLHDVTDTFGQYQEQATRTLADDERTGGSVAGQAPDPVLADYTRDNDVLFGGDGQSGLMSAAKSLEQTSKEAINTSADSVTSSLNTLAAEFLIFGALLVGGLVAIQHYLFRRFHRVLNPALIGATVVALIIMLGGTAGANNTSGDFHTAKNNAFDSVLALGEANALSAGINSDESRWLLVYNEPSQADQFTIAFLAGEQAVAGQPQATSLTTYAAALKDEAADRTPDTLEQTTLDPNSSFGQEFHNITFPGEGEAALAAFNAYDAYVQDDAQLRAMPLNTEAGLRQAINFDTNADTPGSSDQAFNAYSTALGNVTAINEAQFKTAMPAARNRMGVWTWLPYVLAALLIGLTVLGLRPRLTEYR
ncbi:hypothetical protein KGQ20_23930 [Catenulispora sp. NF23]|uniref:Secreted protein n=1 Tax=Catenulispora pinistramenti TaxID=2705254 RepID=A0ABS5L1Y4_9ACTN|nr:hypothetical protein [Catenulispora pinistramenti]MBS2535817.1 hypothetical protein [Catenulispora pinistramenti]MBS2552321.1 hypothetical protein [Catenulispora pinistramenti]